MPKPDLQKLPLHLHEEINLVDSEDLREAFLKYADAAEYLKNIPADKWDYRYAADKWTIKGVVQHIIDAERIFSYRVLVIVRKDLTTPLVSFEEKDYAKNSHADHRLREDLIKELHSVQESTRNLFHSFTDEQLLLSGTVNNYAIDVNSLGFVIIGHLLHHLNMIRERYL